MHETVKAGKSVLKLTKMTELNGLIAVSRLHTFKRMVK